jgi:hypothetical protein
LPTRETKALLKSILPKDNTLVNRRGIAIARAGLTATLRDVARFGLLFTPSRKVVTNQAVIPIHLLNAIEQGRKEITPRQSSDNTAQ